MSSPGPLQLEYLSPFPRPPSTFPKPDSPQFTMLAAKLAAETAALFAAPGWIERKSWHGGLAETSCLPGAAVRLAPPPKETADDPAVQAQRKKNKALKGEDGLARLADGLSFHQRATVVDPHRQKEAEGLKYEHFWNALAKDHIEHEKTYVDNFRDAVSLDRDGHHETYLKLYDLPFPTQNRSFLARLVVVNNPPDKDRLRSFAVYAFPVVAETQPEEKGHTRGRFVSVEEVRELGGGRLLWRCASMSTPGGSIPSKLSEGYAAGSMAAAAPQFLKWLREKVKSTPGFDEAPEVAPEVQGGEERSDGPTAGDDAAGVVKQLSLHDEEETATFDPDTLVDSQADQLPSTAASTPAVEKDEFVLAPEAPDEQLEEAAAGGVAELAVADGVLLPSMKGFELLTVEGILSAPVAAH